MKVKILDLHVPQLGFCSSSFLLLPTGKALGLSVHIVFPDTLIQILPKSEAKFRKCTDSWAVTTVTQMLPTSVFFCNVYTFQRLKRLE